MAGCPRAKPRRAGSRSRYIFSFRTDEDVASVSPIPDENVEGLSRDQATHNSQFSRSICIFEPQNPNAGNVFMRFVHETVHAAGLSLLEDLPLLRGYPVLFDHIFCSGNY